MMPMNARVSVPEGEDPREITAEIGPMFLMDRFFNNGGLPSTLNVIGSNGANLYSMDDARIGWIKPLAIFGLPIVMVTIGARVATEVIRDGVDLIVPSPDEEGGYSGAIWMDILGRQNHLINNEREVRTDIEIWRFGYQSGLLIAETGWMIETLMAKPLHTLTFDKKTHRVAIV